MFAVVSLTHPDTGELLKVDVNLKKRTSHLPRQILATEHDIPRTSKLFLCGRELEEKTLHEQGLRDGGQIAVKFLEGGGGTGAGGSFARVAGAGLRAGNANQAAITRSTLLQARDDAGALSPRKSAGASWGIGWSNAEQKVPRFSERDARAKALDVFEDQIIGDVWEQECPESGTIKPKTSRGGRKAPKKRVAWENPVAARPQVASTPSTCFPGGFNILQQGTTATASAAAPTSSSSRESFTLPKHLQQLQAHLDRNPEVLAQMLNSPAMLTLLNDQDFLRSVLHTRTTQGSADLVLSDFPDTDLHEAIREDFRNATTARAGLVAPATTLDGEVLHTVVDVHKQLCGGGSDATFLSAQERRCGGGVQLQRADEEQETFDVDQSAIASMMQDRNLQTLLAQYMEVADRDNEKMHDPLMLRKLFQPAVMQACATFGEAAAAAGGDPLASGGGSLSARFGLFLEANQHNPENVYKAQLLKMRHAGFLNTAANVAALERCDGSVVKAIELLLLEEQSRG
eukprot:CAMPEP_0178995468 /NCGR_PEP_ID=MMETSP0795-20121207/7843_1 /TAXON_ID=88552 /ORGANISM="Amoebophrya sp., Strain Ameob2" /LENGTH=514 /DNA_ID=CAMNT_0020687777 /DNA_START=1 /DNA_END=1545 /DNA_ORIENTATION=+